MGVTQHDIAKIAKVSQATVSRVLAGDLRVEGEIRHRVLKAMKEHNYQPDTTARSLRSRRTHLIGLVLKRPTHGLTDDPFFASLIAELMDLLAGTPYHLCVEMVHTSPDQIAAYDEMLRTRRVDGVVLVEPEARDERIHRLQEDSFPFVLIGNPMWDDRIHAVDNDNIHAGRIATEHLFEQGYPSVGILAGPEGITVSEDRIEGYRQVVAEHGAEVTIVHSEFGLAAAYEASRATFEEGLLPSALVVLDDFMAMGVLQTAREFHLNIPKELGLASFNDSGLCTLMDGGLTSVNLNLTQLVRTAACTLLALVEGDSVEGPTRTIVPCDLVVRGSSRLEGVG